MAQGRRISIFILLSALASFHLTAQVLVKKPADDKLPDAFDMECLTFDESSYTFPPVLTKLLLGEFTHEIRREDPIHNVRLDKNMKTYHCAMYYAERIGDPYVLQMTNDAKGDFCCPIEKEGMYYFIALGDKSFSQIYYFTPSTIRIHAKIRIEKPELR